MLTETKHSWDLAGQKPMYHLNLDNLMDFQERNITNRRCRESGVQGLPVCNGMPVEWNRRFVLTLRCEVAGGGQVFNPARGGEGPLTGSDESRLRCDGTVSLGP
ncbi:hypothetical protein J6590_065748 [Homalodisca vitripennis]|nr:hypothetical protein J6590_065748 [Homalodisca vitripennis]